MAGKLSKYEYGRINERAPFLLPVRVIPNASRNEIRGWMEGELKIKVQAPPEGGRANREVIKLLSRTCGLPRRNIRILSGESSRRKKLSLTGISETEFKKAVKNCL